MRRSSVLVKLWVIIVGLIVAVMVPLEFALHKLLTNFYTDQVLEPMLYHSEQIASMLVMDRTAIQLAPMVSEMVGADVVVVDPAGKVFDFPDRAEPPLPAAPVQRVLAGSRFAGQLTAHGEPYVLAGVPVPQTGGAVFLLTPAGPLKRSLTVAQRYLWAAGAVTFLVGTGLALQIARSMVRPVREMEQVTKNVAHGDFSVRVAAVSDDEIGQLGRAINQMIAQLGAFETRRQQFLANVAHELRTPLSYIRGYAQAVTEGLVSSAEERNRYLQIVQEESIRISRLVDDLLDLAQMEEGQMVFDRSPLDLRLPIEQAVATVRPMAEARGVRVEVELPDALPQPLADGSRIQQVVFNLVDNGLRYSPEGGVITVTASTEGDDVVVRVADTGPGIDRDLLPLIFERFQKRHSEGRGLGLAIVRSIVRAHGGEVGVHSRPGQGSTFWFRLPVPG